MRKLFLVASVSSTTNSFGLTGMILMARDGECWEVAANSLNVKTKGEILIAEGGVPNWSRHGFEIPERKTPNAPQNVIDEVFGSFLTGDGYRARRHQFSKYSDDELKTKFTDLGEKEREKLAERKPTHARLMTAAQITIVEIQVERHNRQLVLAFYASDQQRAWDEETQAMLVKSFSGTTQDEWVAHLNNHIDEERQACDEPLGPDYPIVDYTIHWQDDTTCNILGKSPAAARAMAEYAHPDKVFSFMLQPQEQ